VIEEQQLLDSGGGRRGKRRRQRIVRPIVKPPTKEEETAKRRQRTAPTKEEETAKPHCSEDAKRSEEWLVGAKYRIRKHVSLYHWLVSLYHWLVSLAAVAFYSPTCRDGDTHMHGATASSEFVQDAEMRDHGRSEDGGDKNMFEVVPPACSTQVPFLKFYFGSFLVSSRHATLLQSWSPICSMTRKRHCAHDWSG
jgi:hypothetical protein